MSHTDIHRPGWVKEQDPTDRRHFVVDHRHLDGPCDIDQARNGYGNPDTRCHRRYVGGRNIYCGCHQCTGHRWRRYGHHKARAAWRTDRQRLMGGLDERPARRLDAWF